MQSETGRASLGLGLGAEYRAGGEGGVLENPGTWPREVNTSRKKECKTWLVNQDLGRLHGL